MSNDLGNGTMSAIGVSILGIGMITGMHAAISPSVFTFTCFARKPEEKAIARKTLWISLGATTVTSVGLLLVFKQWLPALISEATALGLFGLGMYAVECSDEAPANPSMAPGALDVQRVPSNMGFRRVERIGHMVVDGSERRWSR